MSIRVFVDGCRKKNGDGGIGIVIYHGSMISLIGNYSHGTTNNRMELDGPIGALTAIKPTKNTIIITSDSKYFVDGFNSWMHKWERDGWKKKGGEISNLDLWKALFKLKGKFDSVKAEWVKGHSGNEANEMCDRIANYCNRFKVRILGQVENNGRNILGASELSMFVVKEDIKNIHVEFDMFGPKNSFIIIDEDMKVKIKDGRGLEEYLNDPFLVERRRNLNGHPTEMILVPFEEYRQLKLFQYHAS